jgi:type IV pilus assembly protein PilN
VHGSLHGVKTLHLNLASKPFRDYRPVWAVAAALAVLSGILLINNAQTAYRYFVNTKTTRSEIDRLHSESDGEARRARQLQNDIQRFDKIALNTQTTFINAQIAERAFSWSALLDQLERIVPHDVRLVTLNPSITPEGNTHLTMVCRAKSSNGTVEMIRRLQGDPHFERTLPLSETTLAMGLHEFRIETDYRPEPRVVIP